MKKTIIVTVAVVAAAAGWYAFRPERLFVNQTVSESLEGMPAAAAPMSSSDGMSSDGMASDRMSSDGMASGGMAMSAEDMPPMTTAAEPMPAGGPKAIAAGAFHDGSHETRGTATVYQYGDGRRVLRLTGFHTSNGPDVQVLLVAANDAKDNETVTKAGYVHLGALKGNIGDQNYELPAGVDLSKHRAVTIWCRRFAVNFGTAPLTSRS